MRRSRMTGAAAGVLLCAVLVLTVAPAQAHQSGCNAEGAAFPVSNSTSVLCTYLSLAGGHTVSGCAGTPGSYVGAPIAPGGPITAPAPLVMCFPPTTYPALGGQRVCVAVDDNHGALAGGPTAPVGSVTCGEV